MSETTEPRNKRKTLVYTQSELADARLVASFHELEEPFVLREWSMPDIRSEASRLRAQFAAAGAERAA